MRDLKRNCKCNSHGTIHSNSSGDSCSNGNSKAMLAVYVGPKGGVQSSIVCKYGARVCQRDATTVGLGFRVAP